MHPRALRALAEVGVDGQDFRSRRLSKQMLTGATLVLAATREQRAECVRLWPGCVGRAFTMLQFARMARFIDPAAGAWAEAVAEVRGRLQPVTAAEDDLGDPVQGTMDDMRACRIQIEESLEPILKVIASP